jgi:ferritin-like metal-binding protein YciE
MTISSLHELLIHQLRDLHNAEKQITRSLPKMVKASEAVELQGAFKEHLEETATQIKRLEQAFDQLEVSSGRLKCKGMEGLVEEGAELMEESQPPVRDVGIIGAAQKVEHYEIAGYGTARALAELLGEDEVARLLGQTLAEEERMDRRLNEIALRTVNRRALEQNDVDEEEEDETGAAVEEPEQPRSRAARGKAARGR